jgi:hypothetical protein
MTFQIALEYLIRMEYNDLIGILVLNGKEPLIFSQ